jgi:surface protein
LITIPTDGTGGTYTVDWGDGTISDDVSGDQDHVYDEPGDYHVSISGDLTRIFLNDMSNAQKLLSIDQWGTIQWSSMESSFSGASNMVYHATDTPDLSAVRSMSHMFYEASLLNGDLSGWDVSGVTDMSYMFNEARSFNSDLSGWDVSGVTDMSYMFSNARSFNSDLSS